MSQDAQKQGSLLGLRPVPRGCPSVLSEKEPTRGLLAQTDSTEPSLPVAKSQELPTSGQLTSMCKVRLRGGWKVA
jgi:hypothetical protein